MTTDGAPRTIRACACARRGRIDPVCPHCRGEGEIVRVVEVDAPSGAAAPLPVPPPPKAPRPSDASFRRFGVKPPKETKPRRRVVTLKSERARAIAQGAASRFTFRADRVDRSEKPARSASIRDATPKVEATRDHWRADIRDPEGKFASTPMHDDFSDDAEP